MSSKTKIIFQKGNKIISIYKGKQFIGSIDINDFIKYVNDPVLDVKSFEQI